MRYKLKAGRYGGSLAVNINGRYYRLKADEFREYPPELVELYKSDLTPEHEPKPTIKDKEE